MGSHQSRSMIIVTLAHQNQTIKLNYFIIISYADHKMECMIKMDGQHFVQLLQQQVNCHNYAVHVYMLPSGG